MVESYLLDRLNEKKILLMTHIVLGYPSFEEAFRIIEAMVEAGVDLMELQIPFSEPIADGPVILKANQRALESGTTVQKCIHFTKEVTQHFDIPFLFMSYYNILFKYGVERFVAEMASRDLRGAIVPDLPPEEGGEYLNAMGKNNLDPIFIFVLGKYCKSSFLRNKAMSCSKPEGLGIFINVSNNLILLLLIRYKYPL